MPALRRLHPVDLGGRGLLRRVRGELLGEPLGGGGPLRRVRDPVERLRLRLHLHGRLPLRQPAAGERRHDRGGGGEQQQGGDDEPVHERLRPAGERHPGGHPDAADARVHLDRHARRELEPGQPHQRDEDRDQRARPDPVREVGRRRHLVGQRRAEEREQRERDAGHQRGERDERSDAAMTSPALRRPLTRTGVLCPCRVTIAPLPFSGPRTSPSS
ncbi:hypothetical protein [Actinomadura madurae]|uniref:hypothetical protein n=1 Tax=Actinomadura madurae TaxID=1993 RepID=UPI0020D2068C|nr:hypothetical protein [Actinomadura madurae]MCQ0016072.1 hypothetical protein [Actinomadura madurae]